MHFVANFLEHYLSANHQTLRRMLDSSGTNEAEAIEWAKKQPLIHAHFSREPIGLIKRAAQDKDTKVIIPLRDPLLSLVTWRHRNPNAIEPTPFIVKGWADLLSIDEQIKPLYVPVDITKMRDARRQLLMTICMKAGVKPQLPMIEDWALRWPAPTGQGDYQLKCWYKEGNVQKLNEALGQDFKDLKKIRGLKRFLNKRGYRNLIW